MKLSKNLGILFLMNSNIGEAQLCALHLLPPDSVWRDGGRGARRKGLMKTSGCEFSRSRCSEVKEAEDHVLPGATVGSFFLTRGALCVLILKS